jgi:spoIIIJ-associated protein
VYDAKNEAREFVGFDREEMIERACQFFGIEADALSISSFKPGEVYGLATRAVIVAIPKNRRSSASQQSQGDAPRRDEGGRGGAGRGRERDRGRDRDGERDRGRDRDGNRGRGRQSSGPREDRFESASPRRDRSESASPRRDRSESASPREDRSESNRPSRPRRGDRTPEPEIKNLEFSNEASVGTVTGEIGEIGEFVLGVMERMDLGPFQISESDDDGLIVLQVNGPAGQVLAAGEGRSIDAIQLLANQVSVRLSPDRPRVVIDVEGGAEAREDFLTKLADRVAKRALQTGRAVALDPMNSRDRRLIHVALRDRDDVATMSEGAGRYRQVVVVPEGADEFEEAREQSDQVGNS